MKPNLKLKVDIKSEIISAKSFFDYGGDFVSWFYPPELHYIIKNKYSRTQRNKVITDYVNNFYKENKKEIRNGVAETKKEWKVIENNYYELIKRIFQGHKWPKGNYTGYASIFSMYPRYIAKKFFSFPYNKTKLNPLETIAHEMMHFIFFDYIKKNYGIKEFDTFAKKNPKYVWQISETFNTVIENWEPYKKIFKAKNNNEPYPGCEKMFQAMTKQWEKNQDIKIMLNKWFRN